MHSYSQAKTNDGMRIGRLKIEVVDHAQTTPHANLKSELRECVTGAAVADLDMQACHSCILLELIADSSGAVTTIAACCGTWARAASTG